MTRGVPPPFSCSARSRSLLLIVVRQHFSLVMLKVGDGVRAEAVVDCCERLEGI